MTNFITKDALNNLPESLKGELNLTQTERLKRIMYLLKIGATKMKCELDNKYGLLLSYELKRKSGLLYGILFFEGSRRKPTYNSLKREKSDYETLKKYVISTSKFRENRDKINKNKQKDYFDNVKIGDIFTYSYSQRTKSIFLEVIRKSGKSTLEVKKINSRMIKDPNEKNVYYQQPIQGSFVDDHSERVRIDKNGQFKIGYYLANKVNIVKIGNFVSTPVFKFDYMHSVLD